MMTFTSREGDTGLTRDPNAGPLVGQFYLDVPSRRLHCLNDTARQLHDDALPLTEDAPTLTHLRSLDGAMVRGSDLPTAAAARDGRAVEADYLFVRPGRPARHLHWSAAPLKDPAGRVSAVLASVTSSPPPPDWSAMAGLAHDLRTPLHSVGLLTSLLELGAGTEDERREILSRLRSAAERARLVAGDLLDRCRAPGAAGRPVLPSWFAVGPFLLDLLAEQRPEAGRKSLHLAHALGPVLGWQVFTDTVKLGRVVANLLANAVRYTPPGGRVSLNASWEDRGGSRFLSLSVADTGAGIPSEEQESIFNPFERGRSGRESDPSGSGVGLSVVDRLTRELGLRRELDSEFGRGSAFRVLVPLHLLRLAAPAPVADRQSGG